MPKEDKNNAVYQLSCKNSEAVYVGETKRTLNIRAEEHITAIKSVSKRSHTAEHCWKYNYDFDWVHKKVLDFEKNWKQYPSRRQSIQKKKSIISMEYPSSYQISGNQYYEKQSKENNRKNYNIIKLSPQRSANKYVSIQVRNQVNQSETTLKYFDPLRTHKYHTHTHTHTHLATP